MWPGNPVNRRWRCHDLDLSVAQDVEQPAGACLLVRGSVWQELGGLDERFHPLWFEDVDFCQRLKQRGVPQGGTIVIADRNGIVVSREPLGEK